MFSLFSGLLTAFLVSHIAAAASWGFLLTYKSREALIKERITALANSEPKQLHFFEPAMPSLGVKRHLVMSSDVRAAIVDDFPDEYDRHGALLDFFQTFAEQGLLSVSENPKEHPPDTMVARNSPVEWDFWDFRVYAGKKSIRVCGAFACSDTFVALTWDYREAIGDDFDQFVRDAREEWDRLFAPLTPFKGKSYDEYLSNSYLAKKT